jgi:hypothetical protein
MNIRLFLISSLILWGIHVGFSQTIKPLPENRKAIDAKYHLPLLGRNVFVFDPAMDMEGIQTLIDSLYSLQSSRKSEYSKNRYAFLFKAGTYKLDIKVGYYMHVLGLGNSPDDVVINGAVSSVSTHGHHVLTNFWRAAENLSIVPAVDSTNTWAVSQAAPIRRIHVKGNLKLSDGPSSGGFMADCKIDGTVFSGSQQQWFTRNSVFKKWKGGVWNMMFVGVTNAPKENWPEKPYTTIKETPEIREKPYWVFSDGKFYLKIPALQKNSSGIDWSKQNKKARTISMDDFYVAKPDSDNAKSINRALRRGQNILFTPGIYLLDESLKITRPGTIVMGIGMATLVPEKGNMAIDVSDVEGVTVAGLLIDASVIPSETLMQVGEAGSKRGHVANSTFLYDLFFRVGGAREGAASRCLVINSNHVFVDHVWLWRADHGIGVGWDKNKCANGLIVNGNNVTIYGLFNEHFQKYQTLWNGENGRVYFYQSEMPYYPPSVDAWKHGKTNGYASYKVSDHVKTHQAWGVGIYNVFYDAPIIVDQAIETPSTIENNIHHIVVFWLSGNKESVVKSIINGKGDGVNSSHRKATMN